MTTCPKCGTIKTSGILSCCARGGSWFQNCGGPNDDGFDHTWFEGIQACKTIKSFSGQAQSQGMLREKTTIYHQAHLTNQSQTHDDFNVADVRGTATVNSKGCHERTATVACTSLLFIAAYM